MIASADIVKFSTPYFVPFEYGIPVQETHSDMVKFTTLDDETYKTVVAHMLECIATQAPLEGTVPKQPSPRQRVGRDEVAAFQVTQTRKPSSAPKKRRLLDFRVSIYRQYLIMYEEQH